VRNFWLNERCVINVICHLFAFSDNSAEVLENQISTVSLKSRDTEIENAAALALFIMRPGSFGVL